MKRKLKNWLAVFLALIMGLGTLTAQNTAPLNEGFENGIPTTWTVLDIANGSGETWGIMDLSHSGDYSIFKGYDCDGGTDTYLVTPQLLPSDGNHILSFYLAIADPNLAVQTTFTIEVSTTGASASDFTSIATITFPSVSVEWEERTVDLSAYIGQPIYIAFHYIDNCGTSVLIDDVSGVDYIVPACAAPNGIAINNITTSSATVAWTGDADSYQLKYKTTAAEDWTTVTTSTNPYTIEGLEANTNYMVELRSVCGSDLSAAATSFSTPAPSVTEFPYNENFEGENQYVAVSGTGTNQWFIGSATGNDGNSLYISNDNGVSNAYSLSTSDAYAIINVVFGDAVGYDLSFDWKANGENGWDMLNVYLLDVDAALPSGRQTSNSNAIFHQSAFQESWTNTEAIELAGVSNTSKKIVFHWYSDNSGGSQPPAAVDNISIVAKNCVTPTVPTVSDISVSTADVAWTEEGITVVEYKTAADENWTSVSVTASPKTLTDLTSNTTYTVRTGLDCAGEMLYSPTTTFKTACGVTPIPYTMTFDEVATNAMPDCWDQLQVYSTYPMVTTTNARSGRALEFHADENGSFAVLPVFADLNTLRLSLWTRREGSPSGTLYVGYMTDPGDVSTFTSLFSVSSSEIGDDNYHKYDVSYSSADPNARMAIQYNTTGASSYWYWFVDDITVDLIPSCVEPTTVTVNNITSSTATVNWVNNEANADVPANVQYTLATDTEWENAITVSNIAGTSILIENLAPNANYKVRVQSVCGGSEVSSWKEGTFKTACATITDFPWTEGFESMSTEDWGCWSTEQVSGTDNWTINSYGSAQEGSKFAQKSWTVATANLYTPVFDLSELSNPTISYYYKARPDGSAIDYLRVYYRTSNTAEWQLLVEHSGTENVWQYEERLLPDPSATYQIKFEGEAHGGYGLSLDNLQIRNVACTLPSNVAISNITSTTAQVSWNGEATVVEYKPTSVNEWTSVDVTTSPVTLENLTANTMYDLRVGRLCGEMQYPTNGSTFKTQCAAISVATEAWTTSFEEDASNAVPSCWTRPTGDYPYVYTYSYTNYARTGSKTLYWSYNTNPIALPTFVEDVKDLQLSFFARGGSYYDGGGSMEVGVMTDPTDASTFVPVATITTAYSSHPEEANVVRFKSYAGEGQYIAMRPTTTYSYFVDDVTVELAPTCFEPENIVASSITTTSAIITWEDESESTAWTLEYKKANETEYTAIGGLTEKTYNLPALDVNTIYNVRVTGNCEGGKTVSDVFTFSTSALNVTAIPFTENFEESNSYVQLSGTGTNQWFVGNATATVDGENSLYVSNDGGENNAYTHSESNAYAVMNIEFGDADEYFLSFDWKSRGESASWDRLMVFLMDENEDLSTLSKTYTTGRIFNQSTFTADPTWQNDLITLDGVQNTTKKIVFYWYNDNSGGDNPPAAIDNIMIAECVAPTNVAVSNITEDAADLVWADNGGSSVWNVEYKKADATTWTSIEATTKAYSFSELRPNTTYDVRISGNCNETKYSEVSQFTTLCLETSSEREATICDNETYTDADFTLTAENEGINEIVLQNQYGCDSTITLTLTVNPTYAPVFDVEICEGESYAFNGQSYTEAGTYTDSLQTINGCDSVVTLNLSVTPLNNQTFNATICEGETYNENGFMANESGTYTREVVENGCTSTWTLNLTVTPLNNQTFNATICAGETYNENGFMANESGTYTREVVENGCTSTWTLNLTVLPLQTETIDETICYGETFTYNGQTYSQTGTYTTVVEGEEGACDTEVTINLVIRDANPDIDELVVLDNSELPYTFMGNEYSDYGTYVVTVQDENGCEQVYNLTIQHNSGLNAVESIYNVTLYPNPTMDNATLKVEGLNEEATVVVTDQTGRMISSEKLALGQTEMTINSASLAEGVYYIRIITKNSTRTEKLIRR